ncbi:MAG TPA: type II toxin-antitoxin system VapC family toxin [Kiritimatiellia bacterium]|nr:type II toxin-antitoxin system VapC family toxin [Kiritimatiellia bacterium]
MIILDASALLAFLFQETGHQKVAPELASGCMSSINFSEVLGGFARDGHDPVIVGRRLRETGLEVAPFDAEDALLAANLRPQTDPLGLSLGDRACLALALARGVPVLTADPIWADLKLPVSIRLIR